MSVIAILRQLRKVPHPVPDSKNALQTRELSRRELVSIYKISRVRFPSAQIVVLISCVTLLCFCAQAAMPITPNAVPCPVPKGPILGELRIAQITFVGSYKLSLPVQEQIARSIERQVRGPSVEVVTDEAVHLATAGWEDHGYFKATAASEGATLNTVPRQARGSGVRRSSPVQRIRFHGEVLEISRFRLGRWFPSCSSTAK